MATAGNVSYLPSLSNTDAPAVLTDGPLVAVSSSTIVADPIDVSPKPLGASNRIENCSFGSIFESPKTLTPIEALD